MIINRDEYKGQNRENIGLQVSNVDEVVQDERPVCLLIGINNNSQFPTLLAIIESFI